MGCNGGQVNTPWTWFRNTGVVTGGEFGDEAFCYAYTMPECAHHVDPEPGRPVCPDVQQVAPRCLSSCPDNNASYSNDKKKSSSNYGFNSIAAIRDDLVRYGPITAAFTVYEDFLSYKSGVYVRTGGSQLGGHAVTIVGYGTENGLDYWNVRNSWNSGWGDNGYFKIEVNQCGISNRCAAGHA